MSSADELVLRIIAAYGSLEEPEFHFVARGWAERPYQGIVDGLAVDFEITETGGEGDHGFLYALGRRWALCFSLVGPYGVFARVGGDGVWQEILTAETVGLSVEERQVVDGLGASGVRLLAREELERPVPLRLSNTRDVRVFQALFTDAGLPWK